MQLLHRSTALLSPEDAYLVERAVTRTETLFLKLASASSDGEKKKRVRAILADRHVKVAFAFDASRSNKRFRDFTFEQVLIASERINLFRHDPEPVCCSEINVREKRRSVISFGFRKYVAQRIVGAVINRVYPSLPSQFSLRGVTPAILAAEAHIAQGYTYCAELDIRSFYPSVSLDGLGSLLCPLPRAVLENVVWTGPRTRVYPSGAAYASTVTPKALNCLSQGSAASAAAAERIVSSIVANLPSNIRLVIYADNVLLLGVSKADVTQGIETFVALCNNLAAGPLDVRCSPVASAATEEFEFLGQVRVDENRWEPTLAAINSIDEMLEKETLHEETIKSAQRRLKTWRGIYPLWPDRDVWINKRMAALVGYEALICADQISLSQLAIRWLTFGDPAKMQQWLPPKSSDIGLCTKRQHMMDAIRRRVSLSPKKTARLGTLNGFKRQRDMVKVG